MSQRVDWVEGETAPRNFPLLDGGAAFDLTNQTAMVLVLHGNDEVPVAAPGTVTVVAPATNGIVQFTPASASVFSATKSPYRARFKVTVSGSDYFFPDSQSGDAWYVGKA